MIEHAQLLQEHASELADHYRNAKPGDVGLLLRTPAPGLESLQASKLTVGFAPPDEIADMIEGDAVALEVAHQLRGGANPPGMVRVVIVSDSKVSLIAVAPSMFGGAAV